MSTESRTLWTRLAETLKIRRRHDEADPGLPEVGDDGLLAEPAEPPGDGDAEPGAGKAPGPLARWSKRDQTLAKLQVGDPAFILDAKLQEGYEQVTELIELIRNHLVTQAERSERTCNALEQLARSTSDVPAISRQQGQTLETIADQLETTSTRTQQLAETMSEMPKITRAQTDTLAGINRQLEMAGEQNVVASQTMDKLGTAINALGTSNQAQAEVWKQMDAKATEQNDLLTQLIARQSRRFIMLFVVTAVLAAAAITVGTLALLLRPG